MNEWMNEWTVENERMDEHQNTNEQMNTQDGLMLFRVYMYLIQRKLRIKATRGSL